MATASDGPRPKAALAADKSPALQIALRQPVIHAQARRYSPGLCMYNGLALAAGYGVSLHLRHSAEGAEVQAQARTVGVGAARTALGAG